MAILLSIRNLIFVKFALKTRLNAKNASKI